MERFDLKTKKSLLVDNNFLGYYQPLILVQML